MQKNILKDRRLSVAPMMDWTDRHCRFFHRLLAPAAVLYTEMVTTGAVLHGDRERLLGFSAEEHPLALQLGGSEPGELAESARIAADLGYDEVNLNVGCPSDRVQRGRFGACLMLEPELVRDCLAAMRAAVDIPVTAKTRLGVDEQDSYAQFSDFVLRAAASGCRVFAVHARKAWLSGLSPRENREAPELCYEWVYRLKREHPGLTVLLNGGVTSAAEMRGHLGHVDGVMLGRVAYHDPWVLTDCQRLIEPTSPRLEREDVLRTVSAYARRQSRHGVPVKCISRHVLGLFHGQPGARRWRRYIAEHAHDADADHCLFERAMAFMRADRSDRRDAA
jgi:tRNA-dihydrouridine synthase A